MASPESQDAERDESTEEEDVSPSDSRESVLYMSRGRRSPRPPVMVRRPLDIMGSLGPCRLLYLLLPQMGLPARRRVAANSRTGEGHGLELGDRKDGNMAVAEEGQLRSVRMGACIGCQQEGRRLQGRRSVTPAVLGAEGVGGGAMRGVAGRE